MQDTPIRTLIVLGLALGLFSALALTVTDALFAQGQNQTAGNQTNQTAQSTGNKTDAGLQKAGNQTGEAMQTAGNKTAAGLQTVGNKTGEGLQAAANETGKLLGNVSKGVQEFFNKGGQ
jgi:2-hydroxychromene-2-carboxylate isomerase